jgi:serine/threonine-protein kinase
MVARARTVGPYQLVAEIGRGGMAGVYLALTPPANGRRKRVVVKQLRADAVEDDDFRAMFLDEGRLAQRLRHANIVETIEAGRDGDSCFIVMEFLDGQALSRIRRHARRGQPMPLAVQLRILADVLAGLAYVHELTDRGGSHLGIVHRDVTPQNVFVTYDGQVKVLDFGIAKARERQQVETRVGVVKGKLAYMAPENVRGGAIDHRSDVFSVGIMFWEAITGRRYWGAQEELSIYQKLIAGDLPTGSGAADMTPELYEIAARALAPDPAERFASAAEMLAALESGASCANPQAVGGYVQRLFVEERQRFDRFVEVEIARIESGDLPNELPELEQDAAPLSIPFDSENGLRNSPTVRPGTKSAATISTAATAHSAVPRTRAGFLSPERARWATGAGAAAIVVGAVWLVAHANTSSPSASSQSLAAQPLPTSQPAVAQAARALAQPAVPAPTAAEVVPAATVAAPGPTQAPRAITTRAKPEGKVAGPDDVEEFRREPRSKRALDTEDPWSK